MREILFRGKSIKNQEWVEGFLYINPLYKTFIRKVRDKDTISIEVDPSTVGQYTGLTDKNGKKIFEGDIVLNEDEISYECVFVKEYARFAFKRKGATFGWYKPLYCEVIGNIHDNPELREVEK